MKKIIYIILLMMFMGQVDNAYAYKEYEIGDEIYYKNSFYYVIANSNEEQSYITLLKKIPLTTYEVVLYTSSAHSDNDDGNIAMFEYDTRAENTNTILSIINNWADDLFDNDDLIEIDNYKARLLNDVDLIDNLGFVLKDNTSSYSLYSSYDTPDWVLDSDYCYYTMMYDPMKDDQEYAYKIPYNGYCPYKVIRPVINLKKSVLETEDKIEQSDCKNYKVKKIYNEYEIGNEVYYNNEKYYVIRESNSKKSYVTVLKENPLTYTDISKINDGIDIPFIDIDNIGHIPFDSINISNKIGDIFSLLNNWANSNFQKNDIIKVDNHMARLLNDSDLIDYLGYTFKLQDTVYIFMATENTPKWVNKVDYCYFTMLYDKIRYGEDNFWRFIPYELHPCSKAAVRPVVNINKCALENGCQEVIEVIEDNCNKEESNETDDLKPAIVTVDNTLHLISKVIMISSIILILIGIVLFSFNYISLKKRKK